tara:strand:+ start:82 stop:192 length:111 start_codon:yes stop_codon:yes gene_type:complete
MRKIRFIENNVKKVLTKERKRIIIGNNANTTKKRRE